MIILKFEHNNQSISLNDLEGNISEYKVLHKWLNDNEILEFYEGRDKNFSLEYIKSNYGKKINLSTVYPTMIKIEDKFIGYLQYFVIPKDGPWGHKHFGIEYIENMYSIDIFIGEKEYWGGGIGSTLLNHLGKYLISDKGASAVYIDPRATNERAIKAYEKAGFKKVKILNNHEIFEGKKCDSWLMQFLDN